MNLEMLHISGSLKNAKHFLCQEKLSVFLMAFKIGDFK